jgi:ribosomal protein S18 acetylase RimI-like enzyme
MVVWVQDIMEIRRIRAQEGPRLRAIRLRALADAPAGFGSSLGEAQSHPRAYWEALARETATAAAHALFVAEENGSWYGMARGFVHRDYPAIARLASMWVDPARRRSGVGAALAQAVVRWARGRSAACVQLWVTETNHPAKALYAVQGFVETARSKPLPSNPALREVLMVRRLNQAPSAAGQSTPSDDHAP